MTQSLNKIDPRYVDGSRSSASKVLKLDSSLNSDFRDLISIPAPLETTLNGEIINLDYSQEFHTLILDHDNINLRINSLQDSKGTLQVRIYNNSGNGVLNILDFQKFSWVGQTPGPTILIPQSQVYLISFTYYGNYSTQYPNLKDWVAIFVTEVV